MAAKPVQLEIYRTMIPMRRFEHASASRSFAEAVVTRVKFSDGSIGWGETLPREYVTGETLGGVISDLENIIWPAVAGREIDSLDWFFRMPDTDGNRCINAATCAMELACLHHILPHDATELLREPASGEVSILGGLMELSGRLRPRRAIDVPVTGVIGSSNPKKTAFYLRLMRWFGMRDFKLKLGLGEAIDAENLKVVHRQLGNEIKRNEATLRVDVNGGWSAEETPKRVAGLASFGVCAVEQPTRCAAEEFASLAASCELPLIADETLLTEADARKLLAQPQKVWWNIRLSKNGGFVRSLRLAKLAAENNVTFVLGCMVGESGILSSAQRRFLQIAQSPRFVEGNYGRLLLSGDLIKGIMQFGWGGSLRVLEGGGLGVEISPKKLARFAAKVKTLTA